MPSLVRDNCLHVRVFFFLPSYFFSIKVLPGSSELTPADLYVTSFLFFFAVVVVVVVAVVVAVVVVVVVVVVGVVGVVVVVVVVVVVAVVVAVVVVVVVVVDRKSTRLNSSHNRSSRMPSSA